MTQFPSGVYRPGDSIMHSIDAAVKILCFLLLLIAVVTTDTPAGYTGMLLFTLAAAYIARLDVKRALNSVRRLWWLLLLVILSNFAFYAPEATFGAWWIFTPSYKGLYKGICIALRIAMVLVLANALTSTTAPLKLTAAAETILAPLAKLRVPVDSFIVTVELAVRLLPTLFQDAELIRRYQKAKGVNLSTRGFLNKAETAMPLVLPVLVSAFRRVERLSSCLEARGFMPGQRTFAVKKMRLAAADWAAIMVCVTVCALQIIVL